MVESLAATRSLLELQVGLFRETAASDTGEKTASEQDSSFVFFSPIYFKVEMPFLAHHKTGLGEAERCQPGAAEGAGLAACRALPHVTSAPGCPMSVSSPPEADTKLSPPRLGPSCPFSHTPQVLPGASWLAAFTPSWVSCLLVASTQDQV